jgi:hypothetical protein
MRILTVQLGYIYTADVEEKVNSRRQKLRELGLRISDDADVNAACIAMTDDQLISWLVSGEDATVKSESFVADDQYMKTLDRIEKLASKMEVFANSTGPGEYNEKVEVYTPGMGLMLFNRVMLAEDACSDQLQTHLDEGWKIIAACPQPNQRRPDYILGRYDPDRAEKTNISTYAERG